MNASEIAGDVAAAVMGGKRKPEGGVKDTIESILVAFILAFVFRAFVVEAFVIPTGSMAPTLMGAHMRFTCTDCGYHFDTDFRTGEDLDAPSRATNRVFSIICPNCGYRLPRNSKDDPENDATSPSVHFGDRILVLKYLYQFTEPHRWDVVVFKSPANPEQWHYSQNYIKRLIGKPGESIMVLDGDIYVGKKEDKLTDYQIQTKPRSAQEAMWRIVYDNDYQPKGAGDQRFVYDTNGRALREDPTWRNPWSQRSGGSGWSTGSNKPGERVFTFNNPTGGGVLEFDPPANSLNFPFSTWLGYNVSSMQFGGGMDTYLGNYNSMYDSVSDAKFNFYYQRQSGDGPLRMKISKNDTTFTAEITRDKVRLLKQVGEGPEAEISAAAWTQPVGKAHVEFTNVDYRVALRIDDKDLLVTTPDQYRPNIADLLKAYETSARAARPTVSIAAANQQATLEHVSLWRDVYYTNRREPGQRDAPKWATPEEPAHLGDDEYFTMGDNSSNSSDARYWETPITLPDEDLNVPAGRVPGRFMLGKAFFVYWPAGHRVLNSGIIPDFGDMRFIH